MKYNSILSNNNQLIKQITKLSNNAKLRYRSKLAVVSGSHLVEEAIKANILHTLLILEDSLNKYSNLLKSSTIDEIYILSKKLMAKINLVDSAVDIIALIVITSPSISSKVYNSDCVILEDIQDPGNLGTIIRSCVASGVKNIVLSDKCVDIYNPKVLRSAQGVYTGLNIFVKQDLINFINNYQQELILTKPNSVKTIYETSLLKPVGFIFGNEGSGVTEGLTKLVANHVKIPMVRTIDSLNVAMAATICLFEMQRQRMIG